MKKVCSDPAKKTICGIISTIFVVVVAAHLLPSLWFWVLWEVVGGMLVAVGCAGEWYLFKHPVEVCFEGPHRARELQFLTAVAIGVTMELLALSHSIPEAIRLEKDVASLTHTNLLLRSNVATLEWQVSVANSNALRAAPLNRPVTSLLLDTMFLLKAPIDIKRTRSLRMVGFVLLGVDSDVHRSYVPNLNSHDLTFVGSGASHDQTGYWYSVQSRVDAEDRFMIGDGLTSPSARYWLDHVNILQFSFLKIAFPDDDEVIAGRAELTINGGIHQEFEIAHQKSVQPGWFSFFATNSPGLNRWREWER